MDGSYRHLNCTTDEVYRLNKILLIYLFIYLFRELIGPIPYTISVQRKILARQHFQK